MKLGRCWHPQPVSYSNTKQKIDRERCSTMSDAAGELEPLVDISLWVDTTLRNRDVREGRGQPVSNRLADRHVDRQSAMMGSFVGCLPGAPYLASMSIPERERLEMRSAELEQCSVDDFWGLVANQKQQAEAIASMEREDLESQAMRAWLETEIKFGLWEEEDLRTQDTRSVVRKQLENSARRGYMEVCSLG